MYGTGRHTWELLNNLKEYNIIGVADFSYVGREHSVLNVADAAKADFIVIIARPMLLKKLYTKIRQSIINIPVYTIEGDDLDQVLADRIWMNVSKNKQPGSVRAESIHI